MQSPPSTPRQVKAQQNEPLGRTVPEPAAQGCRARTAAASRQHLTFSEAVAALPSLRTNFGGAARSVLVPAAGAGSTGAGSEVTALPAASGAATYVIKACHCVLKTICREARAESATVFSGEGAPAKAG